MIDLMHGDCLELMKKIPDNSVDMCLTDPPYGTTACKWDSVIPFEPMWQELKRIVKDNGAICLFGSEPFSSHLRLSNLKMFKYDWYWNKLKPSTGLRAKIMPLRNLELISVFCKRKCQYLPQMSVGKLRIEDKNDSNGETFGGKKIKRHHNNKGLKYPKHLIEFSNANQNNRLHPTQKPVPLLEYLIKTYTLENETVLDFTMGSGSTGVAAKNLGRHFIGIEKDDKYFNIARERIHGIQKDS
jgi:DNA modification methylase